MDAAIIFGGSVSEPARLDISSVLELNVKISCILVGEWLSGRSFLLTFRC